MLEIFIVWALSRRIAEITKRKGRGAAGWVIMFIALWIGGELTGLLIGGIVAVVLSGGEEPNMLVAYVGGLAGAATGAIISFAIVNGLSPLGGDDEYWRPPESDDYREKFNVKGQPGRLDAGKYRPADEGDETRRRAEDEAYRPRPQE